MLPDIPRERVQWRVWAKVYGGDGKTAATAATTGLSAFATVSLSFSSGNRYSRLRKHLWRDLIVSVAAHTAHACMYVHAFMRLSRMCALMSPWAGVQARRRTHTHTHTCIKYYNLYALYVCVCVNKKEQHEYVKGGMREEKRSMCWKLLETTRIGLAQLMNIDEPYPTHTGLTAPRSLVSIRERSSSSSIHTHQFIAFRRITACQAVVPFHSTCFSSW